MRPALITTAESGSGLLCFTQSLHRVFEVYANRGCDVDRPRMRLGAAGVRDKVLPDFVGVPGLHRRALVRDCEVGEHGIAGPNVVEVPLDDLRFVSVRPAAEVAPEGVDGLPPPAGNKLFRALPVVVRRGRAGQVHTHPA